MSNVHPFTISAAAFLISAVSSTTAGGFPAPAPIPRLPEERTAGEIGFVMQNPDAQIVTDKVWHELAFGLENIGVATPIIRSRVAEMANYFGIHNWFRKKTAELSGGQKAKLFFAKMALSDYNVLILDEPTRNLSPLSNPMIREVLKNFGGVIISVSHDRKYIAEVCEKVLELSEDGLKRVYPEF